MNKEEFIKGYCERSGFPFEWFKHQGMDAYPCNCGEDGCEGWQMIFEETAKMNMKVLGRY